MAESAPLAENRTCDGIAVGESASFTRTVTKEAIELYAAVSGDANPTHLDEAFARDARFPGIVARGMLTAGLISNLLGNRLPGAGTVYRGQELRFAAPVVAGDTVTITVTAREKRPERVVLFDCRCVNQAGAVVLEGVATVQAPSGKVRLPARALPEPGLRRRPHHDRLIGMNRAIPPIPCAVAHPCDASSLGGALDAAVEGILAPILVGPAARIRAAAAATGGLDLQGVEIVNAPHSHAAAALAVELVRAGRAELLMKGSLHTDELMGAVVAKDTGLRTARRISHVFVMDVPTCPEPLFITDAAVNLFPDLAAKVDIVQNAIDLHRGLGLGGPRVAILSAVETVNPEIPGRLDAAALCKMADRGQITGGLTDGPLAMDNAISGEAAKIKGIVSPVAGRAQILVAPDLEAGNMLAKNLSFLANADAAGIVLGAKVPIILTSRADSVRTRMASAAVAALHVHNTRRPVAAGS